VASFQFRRYWNSTIVAAAHCGHLAVLQWARANGCPWDEEQTCRAAVNGGHLELLQWARANGCPFGALTQWDALALMTNMYHFTREDLLTQLYGSYSFLPSWGFVDVGADPDGEQMAKKQKVVDAVLAWLRSELCPVGEERPMVSDNEDDELYG